MAVDGDRGIPVLDKDTEYAFFLDNYLRPLKPCILTGLAEKWPASKDWTDTDRNSGNLIPNFSNLKKLYGRYDGCVTFCSEHDSNGDAIQRLISVSKFINTITSNTQSQKIYLKDFHFIRVNPSLPPPYSVPRILQDDWYNKYADSSPEDIDDFRFLYLGEDGSFTPLHHDVCMSHSWSTSICGIKSWTLIPPEHAHLLYNPKTNLLPKSIDSTDSASFPGLEEARKHMINVTQFPGETIFVPSGWHHQVINHGLTLSINHNWFNGACLERMYTALCEQYTLSSNAIQDIRSEIPRNEFEENVQTLMKANWGMDWKTWWELLEWNVTTPSTRLERVDIGDGLRTVIEIEERMTESEEKKIVLRIIKDWSKREETFHLEGLRKKVIMFNRLMDAI